MHFHSSLSGFSSFINNLLLLISARGLNCEKNSSSSVPYPRAKHKDISLVKIVNLTSALLIFSL